MLRNIHKARCFVWRQNNPEVNYSPTRISREGGGVFLEEVSRSRQRKSDIVLGTWIVRSLYRAGSLTAVARELANGRIILRWIFMKWEGVVGTGWSWLRIGTGGVHL